MTATASDNVQRIREFVHLVQQGKRIDLFDEFFHTDFQDHPLSGGTADREGARSLMKGLHASVDDLVVEIVDCVGQGDIVATHKIFRGQLNRDFIGFPAGQKLNIRVMDFMRLRDGQIIEHWATQNPMASAEA